MEGGGGQLEWKSGEEEGEEEEEGRRAIAAFVGMGYSPNSSSPSTQKVVTDK